MAGQKIIRSDCRTIQTCSSAASRYAKSSTRPLMRSPARGTFVNTGACRRSAPTSYSRSAATTWPSWQAAGVAGSGVCTPRLLVPEESPAVRGLSDPLQLGTVWWMLMSGRVMSRHQTPGWVALLTCARVREADGTRSLDRRPPQQAPARLARSRGWVASHLLFRVRAITRACACAGELAGEQHSGPSRHASRVSRAGRAGRERRHESAVPVSRALACARG